MAETTFTGRGGGTFSIGEGGYSMQNGQRAGDAQWAVQPGGIYSRVDQAGLDAGVWIDPRTRTATDAPMEGQLTGGSGGQFFTNDQGFRLSETGDIWSGNYGAQRILPASGDSPYRQVLMPGDTEGVTGDRYIDEYGVMRRGMMPSFEGGTGTPPAGAQTGAPIVGDAARGGAPGYPTVGQGGGLINDGPAPSGAPGPTTQGGTPGQGDIPVATPHVLGQIQPVTPQPTASATLSDPIQNRLEQLRGPQDQTAAQAGMTNEMDVNWQMNRILDAGNPVINRAMEQARRDVQEEMLSRGLHNTSMAVEIAEKAAWDAAYNIALPMANEAAKAEQAMSSANLQSRAQFQQTGMQLQSQEAQQRAQLASGEILQNLTNNNQITLAEIDRITSLQGIQLSEENKRYLTELTESNKLALQTNASVATAYSNTVTALGQVYSNPDMNWYQQEQASKWYMDQFEGYVDFQDIVNDTNYGEQMNWGGAGTSTQVDELTQRIERLSQGPQAPGRYPGQTAFEGNQTYTWDGNQWTLGSGTTPTGRGLVNQNQDYG